MVQEVPLLDSWLPRLGLRMATRVQPEEVEGLSHVRPVEEVGLDGWRHRLAALRDGAAQATGDAELAPVVALGRTGIGVDLQGSLRAVRPTAGVARAPAQDAFIAGYRFGGGPPELEAHFTDTVIPLCEGTLGWGVPWYHTGNGYVSVGQFTPDSWASAGGGDPTDPWTVGRNVANWLWLIGPENAGTSAGWPTCYWR